MPRNSVPQCLMIMCLSKIISENAGLWDASANASVSVPPGGSPASPRVPNTGAVRVLREGDSSQPPRRSPVWSAAATHILTLALPLSLPSPSPACKRKEQEPNKERNNSQKKSRLVFTDLQRRTLFAIFKENKRPSKEMQITISQQLGLELTTVSNFFMNARRRSLEKWQDDLSSGGSSSAPSTCTKA